MGPSFSSWYVVFVTRKPTYWWDWVFTWGKYKHVCALGYSPEGDQWTFYDWNFLGCQVFPISKPALDSFLAYIEESGGTVLDVGPGSKKYRKTWVTIGTCVSSVKHLTRLKSWAMTPDQLFCAYQKAGAETLFTPLGVCVEQK